jgi:hypothetical protein
MGKIAGDIVVTVRQMPLPTSVHALRKGTSFCMVKTIIGGREDSGS